MGGDIYCSDQVTAPADKNRCNLTSKVPNVNSKVCPRELTYCFSFLTTEPSTKTTNF
jgi:hypothetical protein